MKSVGWSATGSLSGDMGDLLSLASRASVSLSVASLGLSSSWGEVVTVVDVAVGMDTGVRTGASCTGAGRLSL